MQAIASKLITAGAVGAVAIGAGVGAAALTSPWRRDSREDYQDQRYAEIDELVAESARKQDGSVTYPFPTLPYRDEAEGFGQVFSVMVPGGGGLAAAGFGVHALFKGGASPTHKLLGAAGIVAGAALLGAVVGGIKGGSQGTAASDARHGIDVEEQTAEVMRNFDRDGDGAISTSSTSPNVVPEYERRNTTEWGVTYLSIKDDAVAADADADGRVTKSELQAHIASIDTDSNGVISHPEAEVRHPIETYGVDDPLLSKIG